MTEIDQAQLNVSAGMFAEGPIGGHGFRSGKWTGGYQGKRFRYFASVPHAAEFDDQEKILRMNAVRALSTDKVEWLD